VNFLSHFYFERFALDAEKVLGALLPDLLKNADKSYSFQIHKYEDQLHFHPKSIALYEGWSRHVAVDKLFHSSDFFYTHTHNLRKQIEDTVQDLPIRASFLAHISLELLLDHLLIKHSILNVNRLYEHLTTIDRSVLTSFLKVLGDVDIDRFLAYYDSFIASKYIIQYDDINNISYALFNICSRVWNFKESEQHVSELTSHLINYEVNYLKSYKEIFLVIQDKIE
jgi:acyl carrier protein phosphodiesterase